MVYYLTIRFAFITHILEVENDLKNNLRKLSLRTSGLAYLSVVENVVNTEQESVSISLSIWVLTG